MPKNSSAYALNEPLLSLPGVKDRNSRARGPVGSNSTTQEMRYKPLPKKQAARIWHNARAFDRATHQRGQQG